MEKRSRKIVQEKVIEQEAPKRQVVVYEDVPEIKEMTYVVKPQLTYTATCDCGCKCHKTQKSYAHSVRKEMTEQHHSQSHTHNGHTHHEHHFETSHKKSM